MSPLTGAGECQKGIAHRRRTEPLVPGQAVAAVAGRFRARGVAADIGPSLFFGHGHADGRAFFLRRRDETAVIGLRRHPRPPGLRDPGSFRKRRQACIGHGHRAGHTRVGLCHQDHHGAVQDMAGGLAGPRATGNSAVQAKRHQAMISRVKVDFVQAPAMTVEGLQARGVFVGLPRPFTRVLRTAPNAEPGQPGTMQGASGGGHRILQRTVGPEQVDVAQGRRLVGYRVGGKLLFRLPMLHRRSAPIS